MNTRRKGTNARRKAIEQLENDGFEVAVVERTGRFIKDKDAFGIGDLLAVSDNNIPLLVQVTCNRPHNHKLYKEFAERYGAYIQVLQMVHIDNKGFIHYIYNPNGDIKKVQYE